MSSTNYRDALYRYLHHDGECWLAIWAVEFAEHSSLALGKAPALAGKPPVVGFGMRSNAPRRRNQV